MHSLYLRGEDVGGNTYWAWEWADGLTPPNFTVTSRAVANPVLADLDDALPGVIEDEASLTDEQVSARLDGVDSPIVESLRTGGNDREALMVARCMLGALTDRDREHDLFARLGAVLLPKEFLADLRERVAVHGPDEVEVRVLPAPSCVRVPWELLITGNPGIPDERLVDVAGVVTMAPILGRDGDAGASFPDWAAVNNAPPLLIIDPESKGGQPVLGHDEQAWWAAHVGEVAQRFPGVTVGGVHTRFGRGHLSEWLRESVRSRFVYVGHVTSTEATQGKTAMVLNDSRSVYGLGGMQGRVRPLCAQDLVAGTVGFMTRMQKAAADEHISVDEAVAVEFGREIPVFPAGVDVVDGVPAPVMGDRLWPMPPRAAVIACHSGADFAHAEPFGLVTALLENGAAMVAATRWVLLTDRVFAAFGACGAPLHSMAVTVDGLLGEVDPLRALVVWQRDRLAAWRAGGGIVDSPLVWGALSVTDAPDRAIPVQ